MVNNKRAKSISFPSSLIRLDDAEDGEESDQKSVLDHHGPLFAGNEPLDLLLGLDDELRHAFPLLVCAGVCVPR